MNQIFDTIQALLIDDAVLLDLKEDSHTDTLRLVVDSQSDMTLDKTAQIARKIQDSGRLDPYYPGGFRLEVTSPGIGAPLTMPFQYQKNIGRMLAIRLKSDEKQRVQKLKLLQVFDDGIQVADRNGKAQEFAYDDIESAKVKISFK